MWFFGQIGQYCYYEWQFDFFFRVVNFYVIFNLYVWCVVVCDEFLCVIVDSYNFLFFFQLIGCCKGSGILVQFLKLYYGYFEWLVLVNDFKNNLFIIINVDINLFDSGFFCYGL